MFQIGLGGVQRFLACAAKPLSISKMTLRVIFSMDSGFARGNLSLRAPTPTPAAVTGGERSWSTSCVFGGGGGGREKRKIRASETESPSIQ